MAVALGGVAFMVYSQGRDDLSWEGIAISLTGAVLGSFYMVCLLLEQSSNDFSSL